jgi:hypothetical protein
MRSERNGAGRYRNREAVIVSRDTHCRDRFHFADACKLHRCIIDRESAASGLCKAGAETGKDQGRAEEGLHARNLTPDRGALDSKLSRICECERFAITYDLWQ